MKIEIADLGDWGEAVLRSEYDPDGPVIRVNSRVLERLLPEEQAEFLARAIAHEYYHHLEHTGAIPVIAHRAARERAADAYADCGTSLLFDTSGPLASASRSFDTSR
ncbi:MAG TPA: hypothetical protein VFO29_00260 [Candidatus Rubrimentiphilum sp.]|nr:hypothetical protein [Candidatus Rubrimentiphilum sp.]